MHDPFRPDLPPLSMPDDKSEGVESAGLSKEGTLSGFIGKNTRVGSGDELISFKAMMRVDGHLVAKQVTSINGSFIVGPGGQVDANIDVAVAVIDGTVNGNVRATKQIQLGPSSRITGHIESSSVIAEEGATVGTNCKMKESGEDTKVPYKMDSKPTKLSSNTAPANDHMFELRDAQSPEFGLSKFDPSDLDLAHLHPGERNRIRARQFNALELSLLLSGKNPWTKSGKPEPLPSATEQELPRDQLLPLMHETTYPRQNHSRGLGEVDIDEEGKVLIRQVKYTFIDVVQFSERDPESQAYIVRKINEIVRTAIDVCKVRDHHLFLPTGDGVCIALLGDDFDVHLRLALRLLKIVTEHNNQENVPEAARFQIRIGLNQGSDIVVKDINGNQNLAGGVINMASRIMGLCDGGQILVGEMVYADLHNWKRYRDKFREFTAKIKHGRSIKVYQFKAEGEEGLNIQLPSKFGSTDYDDLVGWSDSLQSQLEEVTKERDPLHSRLQKNRMQDLKVKVNGIEIIRLATPQSEASNQWEVLITLWMVNRHEADTAIEGYGLSLVLASGEAPETTPVNESEPIFDVSGFRELSDLLTSRDFPLKRGHPREGVIRFRFKADTTPGLANYELRIKDVYGLVHKLRGRLPDMI